jgi:hypothetical protein
MYLYVMGRGHSGSTILDILLGNSSEIESVGELLAGLQRADQEICSCKNSMLKCPFWRAVQSKVEGEGIDWEDARRRLSQSGAASVWRRWRASKSDPLETRRAEITAALARAITSVAGKPHLLDSSKTPAHALLVLRHLPGARVIHLVRDPREVLQSYVWRLRTGKHLDSRRSALAKRSASLYLAWMSASWTLGNLVCELIARAFPERVVRVRYEDLCAQPADQLDHLGRAFKLDLIDLGRKASGHEPLVVGHNIGGNHLRHADSIRFDPASGRERPPLPRWLAAVNLLLCGPLMWWYGYRLLDRSPSAMRTGNRAFGHSVPPAS